MTYDEDNDIFIGKKPYASWTLNVAEARWQSPAGDAPALTAEHNLHKMKLELTDGHTTGMSLTILGYRQ